MSKYFSGMRSSDQTRFANLIWRSLEPGAPLLAGGEPGLGKTHAYTIALLMSGKKVAIAFPTRALIDQYLMSAALSDSLDKIDGPAPMIRTLLTNDDFATREEYLEHKKEALDAQVLLVTHAAALIDAVIPEYAGLRERDVVLFDEADLLADAADLRTTFRITPFDLVELAASGRDPMSAVEQVLKNSDDPEMRGRAYHIRYALNNPRPWSRVGFEEDGSLVLRHRMPGRMLKGLVKDAKRLIFTSGTLQMHGSFNHFCSAMGIEHNDAASVHIQPRKHGELRVLCAATEIDLKQKAAMIAVAPKPVLVLTTSHKMSQELGELCDGAVVRGPGEKIDESLRRLAKHGVLITAGAWSGLDHPDYRWASVVIPDTPYGVPVQVDGHMLSSYIDSMVVAIRRTKQALYRGLREPESKCTLLLLDPRSGKSQLQTAVPDRFVFEAFDPVKGVVL